MTLLSLRQWSSDSLTYVEDKGLFVFLSKYYRSLDHVDSVLAHVDDTSGYFHGSLSLSLPRQRVQGDVRPRPSDTRAEDTRNNYKP